MPGGDGATQRIGPALDLVEAPFVWPEGVEPPTAVPVGVPAGLRNGRDLFVETDCAADDDCAGGGNPSDHRPHLMIIRQECEDDPAGGTPWFGVVTAKGRVSGP